MYVKALSIVLVSGLVAGAAVSTADAATLRRVPIQQTQVNPSIRGSPPMARPPSTCSPATTRAAMNSAMAMACTRATAVMAAAVAERLTRDLHRVGYLADCGWGACLEEC